MRIGLPLLGLTLVVALAATSCSRGLEGEAAEPAGVGAAPSVVIEIEQSGSEDVPVASDDLAGSGGSEGAASAGSGPTTSVVVHATVPQIVARAEPAADAESVATLAHPTPTGSPLVFLAVDEESSSASGWVEVLLPVQPNGTTGWVQRSEVDLFATPYRIEVDRASHRLRVFERGELWIETPIAVGTGDTPTPVGEFYLLELVAPPDPNGPYGPYAFGLSGFSEVLDGFGGTDTAIIGLHGTNEPEAIGTDVSFGCIRMTNDVIEQLAEAVPLGTPVAII